uniref:nitroreductase family protein n=1 Tax=Parerythrobacter lutipelagi TaxID=1964208 RepID=UPI0010F890F9|nr:nitroreductase family protein [Parerythrobacter lutipelagi]
MTNTRNADPRVLPLIVERWSPRSFTAESMPQTDLEAIFEAAGLAPSAYNIQPWTFLYAHHGDENWDRFLSLLVEFNQSWAKDASVLLFAVSDTLARGGSGEPSPNHSHSFDAGAAWQNLALQSAHMGYAAHGMTGVDFGRAAGELGVPDDHRIEAAIAIGKQAPAERLPEALRDKEQVSGRKPVNEIMRAGNFG